MISLENEIEVILEKEKIHCRGILIPSGMTHTANTGENKVLIFLFDSTTNIAKYLNEISVLDDELVDGVVNAFHIFLNGDKEASDYRNVVTSVFQCADMRQLLFFSSFRFLSINLRLIYTKPLMITFIFLLFYRKPNLF